MKEFEEAREEIADILQREASDRRPEMWHSDIERMTDMLLWLYNEWSRPMTYDKGELIDFSKHDHLKVGGSGDIDGIRRDQDDYRVVINGEETSLRDISDGATLNALLQLLLNRESAMWQWYRDSIG